MSLRVLVAEDEAIIRLDLTETLAAEGYTVVGDCGRGDRAVELAVVLAPDIVMLDIKMPGLDGISAARRISECSEAAIVMLTAFGQRELISEAGAAGVMAFLTKPYRRSDLVAALELAVARRREAAGLVSDAAGLAARVDDLESRLEQRKIIARAKGRLMDARGLGENEAHRLLQQSAMSRRLPMADVAGEVLRGAFPDGDTATAEEEAPAGDPLPAADPRPVGEPRPARSTRAVGNQE